MSESLFIKSNPTNAYEIRFSFESKDFESSSTILKEYKKITDTDKLPQPEDDLGGGQKVPKVNLNGEPITKLSSENDAIWVFLARTFAVNLKFSAIRISDVSMTLSSDSKKIDVVFKLSNIPEEDQNPEFPFDKLSSTCLGEWIVKILRESEGGGFIQKIKLIGEREIDDINIPRDILTNQYCAGALGKEPGEITPEFIDELIYNILPPTATPSGDDPNGIGGSLNPPKPEISAAEATRLTEKAKVDQKIKARNDAKQASNAADAAAALDPTNTQLSEKALEKSMEYDDARKEAKDAIDKYNSLYGDGDFEGESFTNINKKFSSILNSNIRNISGTPIIENISNVDGTPLKTSPSTIFDWIFMYAFLVSFVGSILFAVTSIINIDVSTIIANKNVSTALNLYIGLCGAVSLFIWFNTPNPVFGVTSINPGVVKVNSSY